jgi:hypothetical protein
MKKITTIFMCLVFFGAGVYAQGISVGVKGGLNLANQTYSGNGYTSSPSFRPTIHVGGYATLMFSEHLGLQPELLYSGQGAKSGSAAYKFNYIAIPVLVRYNVNKLLSFHAGPQISLLASAKFDNGATTVDYKDRVKSSDVSAAAGVTVDLPIKLNFTFRFIKGLTDISESVSSVKTKNYTLQLSVGYKLFGK